MLRALTAVLAAQHDGLSIFVTNSQLGDCARLLANSGVYGRALEQLAATDVGVGHGCSCDLSTEDL